MSAADLAGPGVDIELVKQVLRDATREGAAFSMRGLSKEAGLNRDAVYDILADRNQSPTVATLAALAEALGGDLSMFGLHRTFVVSEEMLRREIEAALPHLPKREGHAGQAQYLAEAVADALGLPKTEREATRAQPSANDTPAEDPARAVPKA